MIALQCRRCGSTHLRKNGKTASGPQKMQCKGCNFYGTLVTQQGQRDAQRQQIRRLALARVSQRAMARVTGLSRMTISRLLQSTVLPPIAATIRPLAVRPILAIAELGSFWSGSLYFSPQHHHDWACLLFARLVHGASVTR